MTRLSVYIVGLFSGLLLAAWALASPRHLRKVADWMEEVDQERDVRIALKAVGLHARERAAKEQRGKQD